MPIFQDLYGLSLRDLRKTGSGKKLSEEIMDLLSKNGFSSDDVRDAINSRANNQ